MTGVKGKSGKLTTNEQRATRRALNSKAGIATRDKRRAKDDDKPAPTHAASKRTRFPVQGWIDYKDQLACDLAKRKIEQADIDVATSRVAYDKARGELLTIKEVEAEQERLVGIYRARLASVVEFVVTLVQPDQINDARAKAVAWLDKAQSDIAAEIEVA